jgi:hypothetical protein
MSNMVRTQVYLPRDIHTKLQERAEEQGTTMAEQIREALEDYVAKIELEEEDEPILSPDNPIFQMLGMFDSGLGDVALNHDQYLYGEKRIEKDGQI